MAFTTVGGVVSTDTSSLSLNPQAIGDFFLVEIISSAPHNCSSISGGGCTWTQVGTTFTGSVNSTWVSTVYVGKVTATGSATATYTFSGGAPATIRSAGQEFSTTAGAWGLDIQGHLDGSGTATMPSLTPAGSGELYFGFFYDSGSNVTGTTAGYAYGQDTHSNGICYDTACAVTAQAPTMGDSGNIFGIAILMKETITIVQSKTIADTWSGSFTSNVTAGNSIILVASGYTTFSGTTIGGTNPTYNGSTVANTIPLFDLQSLVAGGAPSGTDSVWTGAWLLPNVPGGSTAVSVAVTNSDNFAGSVGLFAIEVNGLGTAPTLDQSITGNNSSGTTASSGTTGATTGAPEFVLASVVAWGQAMTLPGAAWTNTAMANGYAAIGTQTDATTGSTYSYTTTYTTSASWVAAIATIKPGTTAPTNTISVVQSKIIADTWSGSFGNNVTAGSSIILIATGYNSTQTTLTGTNPKYNGNAVANSVQLYSVQSSTAGGASPSSADTVWVSAWLLPNVAGGSSAVSITQTGSDNSAGAVGLFALEVTGLGVTPIVDQVSTGNNLNGTATNSGTTGAITGAPEFVVGAAIAFTAVLSVPASPWFNIAMSYGCSEIGWQPTITSGGTYHYSTTYTSGTACWASGVVTIKPSLSVVATTSFIVW
jgi:hypothetical protein